jgi:hypothetical protein
MPTYLTLFLLSFQIPIVTNIRLEDQYTIFTFFYTLKEYKYSLDLFHQIFVITALYGKSFVFQDPYFNRTQLSPLSGPESSIAKAQESITGRNVSFRQSPSCLTWNGFLSNFESK